MTELAALLAASAGELIIRVLLAGAVAVVSTSVSLRLLGVRRGWGTALVAGAFGWGTGITLALGLDGWRWSSDGLIVHTIAIAVPVTMAAAVTLDLLSRPGSLAMGSKAGLIVAPRPITAVRSRLAVLKRHRELVGLVRREGFGPLASATGRSGSTDRPGVRIRRILEDAGGVFIKLGQIAATRVDVLPKQICDDLALLQNRVPPEAFDDIVAVVESELGGRLDEFFIEFDVDPLAAASIGQTHRAVLCSGEPVVVKVQRPGIEAAMHRDLAALAMLAGVAERRTTLGQGIRPAEMLQQFAQGLRDELDFRKEADAMEEMALVLSGHSSVRVPLVHRELCTRRLLVQECFEGFTVADTALLDASGVDRAAMADQLLHCMLHQVLRTGFFHADPHPGNVFAFADGSLGLIDFGAVGRLDSIQKAAVADMMRALVARDAGLLRESIERIADTADASSTEHLERALARLMADHVKPTGVIDPAVMQDLVVTLVRFGIVLPTDVVVVARALATVDGTLRVLSPSLSFVDAATDIMQGGRDREPVIDRGDMIRDQLLSVLPHLRRIPERIDRVLALAGRGNLRIRNVVDEDSRRIVRTLVNRMLLTAVGAVFLVTSALLLTSSVKGPVVGSDTGLFEIFGFGGLLAGTILLLRVVAAVARDGTT